MHNSNATKVSLDRNPTDPPLICYGYIPDPKQDASTMSSDDVYSDGKLLT